MKTVGTQFIKYFSVALVGYVVDFGSLMLCKEVFGLHYLASASVGFVLGLIVVYILSGRYVFGDSKINSKSKEFLLFSGIGLIGLGILNLLMWAMTGGLGINYLASKIAATAVVYVWNFLARRAMYHN